MGYGKVGVSKERMCSYKHTHNSAVHSDPQGKKHDISIKGAKTDVIKKKSIENQSKDTKKSEVKKFQSDPNDQEE